MQISKHVLSLSDRPGTGDTVGDHGGRAPQDNNYSRNVTASQLGLFEHPLPLLPINIDDPLIVARL